ncbi:hypothetical protein UFOVP190_249 [uncultured Caudovirales phage]|uniref:Uncharacterized protein n=1 Tax=uncultured Caudovirales phage TaxID=2100421 RepID=A0A6J7WGP8_9CAUD|nr:hypothetical protein UFOVP190_249 [uncultured Caudovirales phage]
MDIDKLVDEVIANNDPIDVVDRLTDLGASMLGTEHEEIGLALLKVLKDAVDNRIKAFEMKAFELAVAEAESRGSTYWEFEEHIVH